MNLYVSHLCLSCIVNTHEGRIPNIFELSRNKKTCGKLWKICGKCIEAKANMINDHWNVNSAGNTSYCVPECPESISEPVPTSCDADIKFIVRKIQSSPDLIFNGVLRNFLPIAIKKIGADVDDKRMKEEMKVAGQLKNHENILTYLFGFEQKQVNYIAMEIFDGTLRSLIENEHLVRDRLDIRSVLCQVSDGLEFMHDKKIAHGDINSENISYILRGQHTIFKITNFSRCVVWGNDPRYRKKDIEDLSAVLEELREATFCGNYHEDMLCVDLIEQMRNERPTASEIREHPFLWTSRETLHFIVEAAKRFENWENCNDNHHFIMVLNGLQYKIFDGDWIRDIDEDLLWELENINLGKMPKPGIVGLIKTIRNLIVHQLTPGLFDFLGPDEESFLRYWTNIFPELVLQLYMATVTPCPPEDFYLPISNMSKKW